MLRGERVMEARAKDWAGLAGMKAVDHVETVRTK